MEMNSPMLRALSSHRVTQTTRKIALILVLISSVEAFQYHQRIGARSLSRISLRTFHDRSATSLHSTQEAKVYPVAKSEEEWKELLTPEQFYILRKEGTETPGASILNQISVEKNGSVDEGTFLCAGCQNPLFRADAKYDSGTGWPSFFAPITNSAIDLNTDYKLVVPRTECVCSQCGGHLGHVFEDGPEPTGQRYCMNGAAMEFYRDSERPELAEQVVQMASDDPFKLSPAQTLPSAVINIIIGGIFFNAFLSSGKSTPIDFLTLLPATYYGFLAAKSIAKAMN